MPDTHPDPITDPRRLAALRATNLLDSPPEISFDRLTQLAARLLNCPASVVTLIDEDRQFFKSCLGLPEPWATDRGSALNYSFCRLAVETDADLVVDDSLTDDRVKDNPSVKELGVRAYAGVPIHSRSGEALGTFCVVDGAPRQWAEADLDILRTLAASVESEIELIELAAREREHHQFLKAIVDGSPLAVAVIDDDSQVYLWNSAAEEMFGYSAEEVLGQPLPIVPPEKQDECRTARQQLADGETFKGYSTYRRHRNNQRVHVKIAAAPLDGFEGKAGRSLVIFDDVSEQVQSNQERDRLLRQLREESSLREALLEQLPAGAVVAEVPSGRLVSVNARAKEIVGGDIPDEVTEDALARYKGYYVNGRPIQPSEWPLARTILEGESVSNQELLLETPDGGLRSLLVSSKLIEHVNGGPSRAISTFTDITELRQSESARHLSEEKSRQIIASSQDCIKILDLDGRLLSLSPGGQTLLEIDDLDSVCGCQWVDFWQGDAYEHAAESLRQARAGRSGRFRGVCPTMRTGTEKWWDVIVTPILGEEGQPEQLLSISRDVTEAVLAEEEREALIEREVQARMDAQIAEEKYRNLVNGLDAIVWEADAQTWAFRFVSQRAEEILGYPIEQWLSDPAFWPSIIHPDDRDASVTLCRNACDECRDHDFEYRALTRDGKTVWLRDIVYVVSDEQGRPNHLRGVMVDVTAKKELEVELRARADELTEMDDRKNQFLAVLAHELRNPLAPIGNAAELLKFCSNDPQQIAEIRETLDGQVSQLVRLIDDLMDISRITRGKIKLQKEPVAIGEVLENSLSSVRPACDVQGHTLLVDIEDAHSVTVHGDRVRLAQVFTNILNNACKYTPPGGRIELQCTPVENDIEVRIQDNGIGISDEDADSIFEMFTQVESSITRSQGGLGIGLTLVKQLVEMHDGQVLLDRTGRVSGSRFVVRLPLIETVDTSKTNRLNLQPTEALNVLVIDDLPAVAKMLGRLIGAMGHRVTIAFSANDGIRQARQLRPQIVFSDICMPDRSGYEVAEALRGLPELSGSMIIAMTGNGQPEDIQKALAAGFHRHLVKPASVNMLKDVFDQFSRARSQLQ